MKPDFDRFFRDYAEAYTRSLGDEVEAEVIRACFTDCFIGAGPEGVVCGRNDKDFAAKLAESYVFYRRIGTRRMAVRRVEATAIDAGHHMAKVFYRADYRKKTGEDLSIDFDVTYLLHIADSGPKIFAFIAGDEMGLYRKHGLV